MMDWQVNITLDNYKERVREAERSYNVYQALHENCRNRDISSTIAWLGGQMLVDLGRRLLRWGGAPTDRPRPETRFPAQRLVECD